MPHFCKPLELKLSVLNLLIFLRVLFQIQTGGDDGWVTKAEKNKHR